MQKRGREVPLVLGPGHMFYKN